jgi:hypothetical protein
MLLAATLAAPADTAELRFTPDVGRQVWRDFDLHMRVQVDSAAQRRTRETAARGAMRQVVARGYRGETLIHLALDTLVLRERVGDGPWSDERIVASGGSAWRQLSVDRHLSRLRVRDGGGATAARLLEWAALGMPGLTLPARRVRPGDAWRVWVRVPRSIPRLPAGPWLDMGVRLVVRLDSVTVAGGDTLFHLTFEGDGVDRGEQTDVSPDAVGVAGTLVWSRGWSAYVAQAVRVQVVKEGRDPAGVRVRASLETVLRSRIRYGP